MMERGLSLHERFGLAISQTGQPTVVVIAGELTCPAGAAAASIKRRVAHLLTVFPALSAQVGDSLTHKPKLQRRAAPISPEEVVQLGAEPLESGIDASRWGLDEGNSIDPTAAPLWRVGVRPSARAPKEECFVVLYLSHIICDGRATQSLFAALLSDLPDGASTSADSLPPRCEDGVSHRPRASLLLRTVWAELLVPQLPRALQKKLVPEPAWPQHRPLAQRPIDCPQLVLEVPVEDGFALGLKALATKIGTRTMHAPLHTACVAALLVVLEAEEQEVSSKKGKSKRKGSGIKFTTSTPMSLRDRRLGHPYTTGNYIAPVGWHGASGSVRKQTVYALTRAYHHRLHPADRAKTRETGMMGMLAFLPDGTRPLPAGVAAHARAHKDQGGRVEPPPTGWEEFVYQKGASAAPFVDSICISNLGPLGVPLELDLGLEHGGEGEGTGSDRGSTGKVHALRNCWFTQSAAWGGWAAGMMISVIGCKVRADVAQGSGMASSSSSSSATTTAAAAGADKNGTVLRTTIVISYRSGGNVPASTMDLYVRALSAALRLRACDGAAVSPTTTMDELVQSIKAELQRSGEKI